MADIRTGGDQAALYVAQAQAQAQAQPDSGDKQADALVETARKQAEKQLQVKLQQIKRGLIAAEESPSSDLAKRWQQVVQGAPENKTANGAQLWANHQVLQRRLTQAQKQHFQATTLRDPPRGMAAGAGLAALADMPNFAQVVQSAPHLGEIQAELLNAPQLAAPLQKLFREAPILQTSARPATRDSVDPKVRADFSRFGLSRLQQGDTQALTVAGDMLNSLAKTRTPGFAQQAALNMAVRQPNNTAGMQQIDTYVRHPAVQSMTAYARGVSTDLLSRAEGNAQVREGFEAVAQEDNFRQQGTPEQAAVFHTIGSVKANEYRAFTDKTLQALRHAQFPTRPEQVQVLLRKMASTAQKKAVDAIDVPELLDSVLAPAVGEVPTLVSTANLPPHAATQQRSQNRIKIINYYNAIERYYQSMHETLKSAQYREDTNRLPQLIPVFAAPDGQGLAADEQAFLQDRQSRLGSQLKALQDYRMDRMMELSGLQYRIKPQKLLALARERRTLGTQNRYFKRDSGAAYAGRARTTFGPQAAPVPDASRAASAATAPLEPPSVTNISLPHTTPSQALPASRPRSASAARRTPRAAQRGAANTADAILAQLPSDLSPAQQLVAAKQLLAQRWKEEMAQVIDSLMAQGGVALSSADTEGTAAAFSTEFAAPVALAAVRPGAPDASQPAVQPRRDAYGIPRAMPADLGGKQPLRVVKSPTAALEDPDNANLTPYTGRTMVRPNTPVRNFQTLWQVSMVEMTRAEKILIHNLGWNTPLLWESRRSSNALWPQEMRTKFKKLKPAQREAASKLGFDANSWDAAVEALT